MNRARSKLRQGFAVSRGRIPLMGRKTIARMDGVVLFHFVIPPDFRKDRGCGDTQAFHIAFDDRRAVVRHFARNRVAIDEDMRVSWDARAPQSFNHPLHRPAHGQMGSVVDIDPIDLFDRRDSDRRRRGPRLNQRREAFACFGIHKFAVSDISDPRVGSFGNRFALKRQGKRAGNHGPRKTSATDFVHPDHDHSRVSEFLLMLKIWFDHKKKKGDPAGAESPFRKIQ